MPIALAVGRLAMLIDTHIHLDAREFDADRTSAIALARDRGVGCFIVPGVARDNFERVEALAREHADVRYALGIHPLYVGAATQDDVDVLEARLAQGGAIAVGEIGLDQFVAERDPGLQERFFEAQLKLARHFDLPVILHVRRAVEPVIRLLRRIEVPGGIAHAFNGSRQQADVLIGMGFKLGFGGAMTYEGSTRIRTLASTLPLSALVLETDAPDIPPAWACGGRTEPADLPAFAEQLASLRGLSYEAVVRATTQNARAVLRLS